MTTGVGEETMSATRVLRRAEGLNRQQTSDLMTQTQIRADKGRLQLLGQRHVHGVVEGDRPARGHACGLAQQGFGGAQDIQRQPEQIAQRLEQSFFGDSPFQAQRIADLVKGQVGTGDARRPRHMGVTVPEGVRGVGLLEEPLEDDRRVENVDQRVSRSFRMRLTESHPLEGLPYFRRKASMCRAASAIFSRSRIFDRRSSSTVSFIR